MVIDPVCGMTLDEENAPCCKRTFEKDPEAVLHEWDDARV